MSTESAKLNKSRHLDPTQANLNRKRFRKQLIDALAPVLNAVLYEFYKKAHALAEHRKESWQRVFQAILREVAEWDDDVVESITERVTASLPWFREVVRQMVVQEIYVLMSSRYDRSTDEIDFKFELPANQQLVHNVLVRVCTRMRGSVALYDHTVDEQVRERNTIVAEDEIRKALNGAIDNMVPIAELVRKHFTEHTAAAAAAATATAATTASTEAEAKEGDTMTLLQSEQPASSDAMVDPAQVHPAHMEIVKRTETLAAAAANDADAAAQQAMQSAHAAQNAADTAAAVVQAGVPLSAAPAPALAEKRARRRLKVEEF